MNYQKLVKLLNDLAQEFLVMESSELGIPTAGKFLNRLEEILAEAKELKVDPVRGCVSALSRILEGTIMETIQDKAEAANVLENGIHLMQNIVDSYKNTGRYAGSIQEFIDMGISLVGPVQSGAAEAPLPEEVDETRAETQASEPQGEKKIEIQDESLTRDFITEGLEYIEEIEINILNLENDPENKDYINAIFRPFHSIKGVASFLNLEKIRSLSHNLESLLDRARNGEISVSSPMIDVVLDGADALKSMIGQLRDLLEGKTPTPTGLDIPALTARIKKIEEGFDVEAGGKKIGEILVDDGIISEEKLNQVLREKEESPSARKLGETLIRRK